MSFYARQMLNRPGPFGQQRSASHQSRDVTPAAVDAGDTQRRDRSGGGGGGSSCGIARFSQQNQPHRQNHKSQNRQPRLFRNELFPEEVDDDDDDDAEHFPIEGSIHAQSQRDDRNFSQITLSQLSDGPSVRSIRSQHSLSLSHRTLARNRDHRGGVVAQASLRDNDNNRSKIIRGSGGVSGRVRILKQQDDRHVNSTPSGGKQKQRLSQSTLSRDADDAHSLKSSQTLLSQYHRPSLNGDSKSSRPASSQLGMSSLKRTSSRGSERDSRQVSREDDENNSIRSSQPLLSVARIAAVSHTPILNQKQHISQLRTPSCLSNLSSLREHSKRYSSGNTTIRTIGAISGTLASFPTPSQALRNMRSVAIRTSSSLVALTPFRKGRVLTTIGSSVGAPLLSSIRRSTAFTPTRKLGQSASSAILAQDHEAPSMEHEKSQNMNISPTSVSNSCPISLSVVPPPVEADNNQYNALRTTNAEHSVGRVTESVSTPVLETHADRKDTNSTNNDDTNKVANVSCRDLNVKTEEYHIATRELKNQLEQLEKSKQEFHDMNERARREMREEYAKLETLQKSMDVKYETMQTSIGTFSSRMSSSTHDHESAIRTLIDSSMNELRRERCRATDAVSQQVHEEVKAQVPSAIRTLIETETKRHLRKTIVGMVDAARSDFQQWVSGLKNLHNISSVGIQSPTALAAENNHLGSVGYTTIQMADDLGNSAPESMVIDPTVEHSRNTVLRNDAADDKGVVDRVSSQIFQYGFVDKENISCDIFADKDEIFEDETPVKIIEPNQIDSAVSYPEFVISKDPTPGEYIDHKKISLSLTPIPQSSMSTLTTPFSRKATPLKNNYSKNIGPIESSSHIFRDIELEVKTDSGSIFDKPPNPVFTSELLVNKSPQHVDTTTNPDRSLIAISSSGSMTRVKVVVNDSSNESPPTPKKSTGSTPKNSKRKTYGHTPNQALVNITSRTVNNAKDQVVINVGSNTKEIQEKRPSCDTKPTTKKTSRKRDHSGMTEDTSISPRRSKRQRESNRAKPRISQSVGGNLKPSKDMPKDRTPIVKYNYDWLDAASTHADSAKQRLDTSKGCDSILGISVTVPTTTHDSQEDYHSGLDDDNIITELSQPEKRSSLTSLLPFVNGFGYRGSGSNKPTKTFSKKRTKSKVPGTFDLDEFNFSS